MNKRVIYVGNLSSRDGEEELRIAFKSFGFIEKVNFNSGGTIGFVTFKNSTDAHNAMAGNYNNDWRIAWAHNQPANYEENDALESNITDAGGAQRPHSVAYTPEPTRHTTKSFLDRLMSTRRGLPPSSLEGSGPPPVGPPIHPNTVRRRTDPPPALLPPLPSRMIRRSGASPTQPTVNVTTSVGSTDVHPGGVKNVTYPPPASPSLPDAVPPVSDTPPIAASNHLPVIPASDTFNPGTAVIEQVLVERREDIDKLLSQEQSIKLRIDAAKNELVFHQMQISQMQQVASVETENIKQARRELAELRIRLGVAPTTAVATNVQTKVLPRERGALQAYVEALAARGFDYDPRWAIRFVLAAQAARSVGGIVLLAGWTGTGKTQIVRATIDVVAGAAGTVIPVRPEWLNSSDLLGYVDPLHGIFASAEFADALADASRLWRANSRSDLPYFLLLDEMNLARVENYAADALSTLGEKAGSSARRLVLYPTSTRERWERERDDPGTPEPRKRELERLLRQEGSGTAANEREIPGNLVLLGTLNTDRHTHEVSPKVLDRSFTLIAPPLTVEEVFMPSRSLGDDASPFIVDLPATTISSDDIWSTFPTVRARLMQVIKELSPCGVRPSHRVEKNARAYLAAAHGFFTDTDDADELVAALVHLLVLPRIECDHAVAKSPIEKVEKLVCEHLDKNHDVRRQFADLLQEVRDRRHPDLRGLRT